MTPFGKLVAERARDPQRCVRECNKFIKRYGPVSADMNVSLEQVACLAAVVYLGFVEASKVGKAEESGLDGCKVITVMAEDSTGVTDAAS